MKLFLIGGFLGSGKTTAIKMASDYFMSVAKRVGVITNDQGTQLVDTEFIQTSGVPAMEVTDGCFCCNYDQLDRHINVLRALKNTEIVFAESVGSCTDLIATIAKPIEKFHADISVVISVFTDVQVLPSLLQGATLFKDSVRYIYKKQLDEADVLIVNKTDRISAEALEKIKHLVEERYPDKSVLYQNSLDLNDIRTWLETLNNYENRLRSPLELDYSIYAEGEAELAWLDLRLELHTQAGDALNYGFRLLNEIYTCIEEKHLPIGHLKCTVDDGERTFKWSYTTGDKASNGITSLSDKGKMLINARVQTSPENLDAIVSSCITKFKNETGCEVIIHHRSAFKPGFPYPTHRMLN